MVIVCFYALALPLLSPVLIVVSLFALGFAWTIPALYAARGAGVLRPQRRSARVHAAAEQRALGLLGDLVGHSARELAMRTGFVVEPARFGVWVVGPAGALLVGRAVGFVSTWASLSLVLMAFAEEIYWAGITAICNRAMKLLKPA